MNRKNSINQPNAASVTFHLTMQGFWAHTKNIARLQNCPDITILVCHGIVSGVTHAVGHAVAHGVYRDIVHVVCHGASHAVNWGSQNFLTLTVQHLLHGNTYHLHISSSTTSSVTSPNTTSTITWTNLKKKFSRQMFIQSFRLSEWFVTLSTWVQLLSSMNEQMSADASSLPECPFAFCAAVWILSTVVEYVLIQTLSLSVWHFTLATHVHGWGFYSFMSLGFWGYLHFNVNE